MPNQRIGSLFNVAGHLLQEVRPFCGEECARAILLKPQPFNLNGLVSSEGRKVIRKATDMTA